MQASPPAAAGKGFESFPAGPACRGRTRDRPRRMRRRGVEPAGYRPANELRGGGGRQRGQQGRRQGQRGSRFGAWEPRLGQRRRRRRRALRVRPADLSERVLRLDGGLPGEQRRLDLWARRHHVRRLRRARRDVFRRSLRNAKLVRFVERRRVRPDDVRRVRGREAVLLDGRNVRMYFRRACACRSRVSGSRLSRSRADGRPDASGPPRLVPRHRAVPLRPVRVLRGAGARVRRPVHSPHPGRAPRPSPGTPSSSRAIFAADPDSLEPFGVGSSARSWASARSS